MTNRSMNASVLVVSCDKYFDTWNPCSMSISKYWTDCPYKKVLVSEGVSADSHKDVDKNDLFDEYLFINNLDWGKRLFSALDLIDTEYIVFLLDDQWPVKCVDQDRIEKALNTMELDEKIAIIYLNEQRKGIKYNDDYDEIPFGEIYRLSATPCLIRREYLISVLRNGCSPWNYERVLSFDKSGANIKVLSIREVVWETISPPGAINRGKWIPQMREYAKDLGIIVDYNIRPELSRLDLFVLRLKSFIYRINPSIIVKIQNYICK